MWREVGFAPPAADWPRPPSSWSLWLTHLSDTLGSYSFRGKKQLCGVSWQCEAQFSFGEAGDRAGFVTRGTGLEMLPRTSSSGLQLSHSPGAL